METGVISPLSPSGSWRDAVRRPPEWYRRGPGVSVTTIDQTQLSVWSTRHQTCLQITHSDNVTVSFRFGQYDGGSQMSDFLYLNINWILLAPLNGGEDVCGESEATVGQGSIYRRYLLFRLHHTKSVQIWCFTWNGKVFDLTGTFTLNKYQAELQSETKLRNCRCSAKNVSSLLTDRIPFSFADWEHSGCREAGVSILSWENWLVFSDWQDYTVWLVLSVIALW